MPVVKPGRRQFFKKIGKLRQDKGHGKKSMFADLNLTAMVDMFTIIVVFLLQNFSASGEIMFSVKDLKLPEAQMVNMEMEIGPVVTFAKDVILLQGKPLGKVSDLLEDGQPGLGDLKDQLVSFREKDEKYNPTPEGEMYKGQVIIQADQKTDFRLVRRAIYDIGQAGWVHINFAVQGLAPAGAGAEGEQPPG